MREGEHMKKERLIQAALAVVFMAVAVVVMLSGAKEDTAQAARQPDTSAAPAALITEAPDIVAAPLLEPDAEQPAVQIILSPETVTETEEPTTTRSYYESVDLSQEMQWFIFVQAGEACVDFPMVLAMIVDESSCDPSVVSKTHDYGLMQINKCNHAWLAEDYGLTDMLDPYQNIIAGITILSLLQDDFPDADMHMILMAYNLGPSGAADAWSRGIYTSAYSEKVMQIRDALIGEEGIA